MDPPPYYAPPLLPPHPDSSRPTLGFPLGTALLLIVIFSLSGVFSCCYHWDKLRHLRGSSSSSSATDHGEPTKPKPTHLEKKRIENESLPVVMPGDRIARFIALPCPCQPPRPEKIAAAGEDVRKAPKPPHIAVTVTVSVC